MRTNWLEDVKNAPLFSYQEYVAGSESTTSDVKMRPGFAAVLYNAKRSDIEQLHQALSVEAGIDLIEDMDCVPTYAVYQDTQGHLHQLYSMMEKSSDQQEEGLPEYVSAWLDQAEHMPLKCFADGGSSLELLVQAQCKTLQFTQSLTGSDFYDSKKCPGNANTTYTVTYKVYAVHNVDDGTDYYLVEQEGMYPFKNMCAATYKKSVGGAQSKIQEYYGGKIVESCSPQNVKGADHCHIERTSPSTTTSSTTIDVGMEFSLSGAYSYSATDGHTGSVSGGLNISNNKSYQVSDVTVSNQSDGSSPKAEWAYEFKRSSSHFNFFSYGQVELDDCALAARNTFVSTSEWLFHVSRDSISGDNLELNASVTVDLVSSRARLDYPCHTGCVHRTKSATQKMVLCVKKPPLPSEQG